MRMNKLIVKNTLNVLGWSGIIFFCILPLPVMGLAPLYVYPWMFLIITALVILRFALEKLYNWANDDE